MANYLSLLLCKVNTNYTETHMHLLSKVECVRAALGGADGVYSACRT